MVKSSFGANRIAPCFFLPFLFFLLPPAPKADETVNGRCGIIVVNSGDGTVQRCKRKNTTLLGGAECKKAVDYRYIMVDRTCDTLSDDRLLPQPDFYRNGKTIRRIVFPATVNSRHSALHSHGFTELCTAFAVHKTNNHPVWSGCLFGASNRTRTCDTAVNSRVLYRLSY